MRRELYRLVPSSFLSTTVARKISAREIRRDEVRSYMYVRLILSYTGKKRLRWMPDAEESEVAAAAAVVARTEMDSGLKEQEET